MNRHIARLFGGKLHVSKKLKEHVCRAVGLLPQSIIAQITSHCWFLGSTEDAWAYTFRGDEVMGKHLVILSDELLNQTDDDIQWTIIHEIGHVVLGHRNAILAPQSKGEIAKQEREADAFARRYILQ